MYGTPPDLPLERFMGPELNQIALGAFDMQLNFAGVGTISVWGRWELHDAAGALIDAAHDHQTRYAYCVHRLLNLSVMRFEIDAPRSFTLVFDPAYRLTVADDTPGRYESFSITFDDGSQIWIV